VKIIQTCGGPVPDMHDMTVDQLRMMKIKDLKWYSNEDRAWRRKQLEKDNNRTVCENRKLERKAKREGTPHVPLSKSKYAKPIDKLTLELDPLLTELGYTFLSFEDIPKLQIDFLETMCKLWPFTLEHYLAAQKQEQGAAEVEAEIKRIQELEKPVLERARDILKVIMWMRIRLYRVCETDLNRRAEVERRCQENYKFFINYFCWMHEPRMPHPLPAKIPFVLYPAQERMLDAMERCLETRQDGILFKSRGAGGSWGFCAVELHHWKYRPEYRSILGSETAEKVDIIGSTNPLFGKLRYLLYNTPHWWRPKTFEKEGGVNDNLRKIINPENKSEIVGGIGVNIGRSGRATRVIIDEAQDLTDPEAVDQALESVAISRIDVGTARGLNHFGQKIDDGKIFVHRINWKDDPRVNPLWRTGEADMECAWRKWLVLRRDPVVVASEYDQDLRASVEDAFIPSIWVDAAVGLNLSGAEYAADGGFDIAAGGDNKSVYAERGGPVVLRLKQSTFKDPSEALMDALAEGRSGKIGVLYFDNKGVGSNTLGEMRVHGIKVPFDMAPVEGDQPASERYLSAEGRRANEKYYNLRAELWGNLRDRFQKTYRHVNGIQLYSAEELISIPRRHTLISQLSQPKQVFRGTKIAVESKRDMRSRGVKSPDEADAVVNAFAGDVMDPGRVVKKFDATEKSEHTGDFEVTHGVYGAEQYVSLIQGGDMQVVAVCCVWWPSARPEMGIDSPRLQVYAEVVEQNALVEDVVSQVKRIMCPEKMPIKEWLANDEMFSDFELGKKPQVIKGVESPSRMFRKLGVALKRNPRYDERASVMLVNRMFDNNAIQIHDRCLELGNQLRVWRFRKGSQTDDCPLAQALCRLVSRLQTKKMIPESVTRAPAGYSGGGKLSQEARRMLA
jgi:phage terminase large subunit